MDLSLEWYELSRIAVVWFADSVNSCSMTVDLVAIEYHREFTGKGAHHCEGKNNFNHYHALRRLHYNHDHTCSLHSSFRASSKAAIMSVTVTGK